MATSSIQHFSSTSSGRIIAGTAGYLISALDECLVNGGDQIPVTNISVDSNVATATLAWPGGSDPYYDYVKVLLHMEGTNGAQVFTDSAMGKAMLYTGQANTATAQKQFGNTSAYFDGSGDSVRLSHADFQFGYSDFTVEGWVYLIAGGHGSAWARIFETNTINNAGGVCLVCTGSDNPAWIRLHDSTNANTMYCQSYATVSNTTWHHFAATRRGGIFYLYIDGILQGCHSVLYNCSVGNLSIGCNYLSQSESFNGYVDEFRITNGMCRYWVDFSPPSAAFPNPSNDSTVVFQCACDGTNGGTTFADESSFAHSVTVSGATTSTFQKKYGTASAYFDGVNAYLSSTHNDYVVGTGDFTLECWVYPIDGGHGESYSRILGLGALNSDTCIHIVTVSSESPTRLIVQTYSSGWITIISDDAEKRVMANNVWHHIALVRKSGIWTLFLNGIPYGVCSNQSVNSTQNVLYIGGIGTDSNFKGYIDNVRFTKGSARYTNSFTVPVATFPAYKATRFEPGQIVNISGATSPTYSVFNDNFRVATASSDAKTITFPLTTNLTNPTGTIIAKLPSLGWNKVYSSGNTIAVYQSSDSSSTKMYLRVDDSNAQYAIAYLYETMTGVSSGLPNSPTAVYWVKSDASTTASRKWNLIGNKKTFYLMVEWNYVNYATQYSLQVFGDFFSVKPNDAYNCVLIGYTAAAPTAPYLLQYFSSLGSSNYASNILARNFSQSTQQVNFWKLTASINSYLGFGSTGSYADSVDGGIHLSPVYIYESTGSYYRGRFFGLMAPLEAVNGIIPPRDQSLVIGNTTYICYTVVAASASIGNIWFSLDEWT